MWVCRSVKVHFWFFLQAGWESLLSLCISFCLFLFLPLFLCFFLSLPLPLPLCFFLSLCLCPSRSFLYHIFCFYFPHSLSLSLSLSLCLSQIPIYSLILIWNKLSLICMLKAKHFIFQLSVSYPLLLFWNSEIMLFFGNFHYKIFFRYGFYVIWRIRLIR